MKLKPIISHDTNKLANVNTMLVVMATFIKTHEAYQKKTMGD